MQPCTFTNWPRVKRNTNVSLRVFWRMFTWYKSLYNNLYNRLDECLHGRQPATAGCTTGCTVYTQLKSTVSVLLFVSRSRMHIRQYLTPTIQSVKYRGISSTPVIPRITASVCEVMSRFQPWNLWFIILKPLLLTSVFTYVSTTSYNIVALYRPTWQAHNVVLLIRVAK